MYSVTGKGIFASLFASGLFGLIYYYATFLTPLTGIEIYGWRILFMCPFFTLFVVYGGYWPLVKQIAAQLREQRWFIFILMLSSALIGVQLWLFMWAPINGKALEVSLGYLLMPLVMVVCGRFMYKERLRLFQKVAVFFAALGVGNQLYEVRSLSLETLVVACGVPCYFMLRRKARTDHLGGLWFDLFFMLPVAGFVVFLNEAPLATLLAHPRLFLQIPVLGILSALAMACYIVASRHLPFSVFGLLGYVEPVLLVIVSLLLGETIRSGEGLTYVGVGIAIMALVVDGVRQLRFPRR